LFLLYGEEGVGKTRLLEEATQLGMRASDGLAMLLHQGARSFELWTGTRAPIEVMRRALYERTSLAKAANKRED